MGPEATEVYNLYSLCQELHSLPDAGGVNDQDAVVMHLFLVIVAATREEAIEASRRRQS